MQYGTSEKAYENLKFFPAEWSGIKEFLLEKGDVLFNRTNSSDLVGKSAVYDEEYPPAVFASYLIRLKSDKKLYNSKLLSYFINSLFGRSYILSVVSQQVGQANVNGTKLSRMSIPLMSTAEQLEIVRMLDPISSITDNIRPKINKTIHNIEILKQGILRTAYEGKLVPQDATDEPAETIGKSYGQEK